MVLIKDKLLERFVGQIIGAQALALRDVAAGESPFKYSSGNFGPGYLMVKGLVSQRELLKGLITLLAEKVEDAFPEIEYVAGNATGGMVPGYILAEVLTWRLGREVPYIYIRNTRKIGGHGEYITGDKNNSFFVPGRKGLVFEELVNFAVTTTNSALVQRDAGYDVRFAATIVSYNHDRLKRLLSDTGVTLIHLLTVEDILSVAEKGYIEKRLVDDYRSFLADPQGWQSTRGIVPEKKVEVTHG